MVKVMLLSLPTEATTRSLCPLEEEILGKICFFFFGGAGEYLFLHSLFYMPANVACWDFKNNHPTAKNNL